MGNPVLTLARSHNYETARGRISVDWVEITKKHVIVLVVTIAVTLVFARAQSNGPSILDFESPCWDLEIIPIVTAPVIGTCRIGGCDAVRRRFLLGTSSGRSIVSLRSWRL
jgi:hypothetical protein